MFIVSSLVAGTLGRATLDFRPCALLLAVVFFLLLQQTGRGFDSILQLPPSFFYQIKSIHGLVS